MKPQYLTLAQIFGPPVRFVVPLFQRPYVWDETLQWSPLWDDISVVADRVSSSSESTIRGHFLGSIVLEQKNSGTGNIERRSVIDGQQRLTTLQLLLKAAAHAFSIAHANAKIKNDISDSNKTKLAADQMESLIRNPSYAMGEEAYKVWPTNDDRSSFIEIMNAETPSDLSQSTGRMPDAYRYFLAKIGEWIGISSVGPRTLALSGALMHNLRAIILDLEPIDEPQAIFETLNTGGAPLLPADLIKNWLLWEASRQGKSESACEDLYRRYWQDFDKDGGYWRTKVGTGHASRPRIDGFLVNWLTERTRRVVGSGHVYDVFRDYADNSASQVGIESFIKEIYSAASLFVSIDQPHVTNDRFGIFLHRLKVLDVASVHPFLLHVMARPGSDSQDRANIAVMIESFLVRRLVNSLSTRGYSTFFVGLLAAVANAGSGGPAAPIVAKYLKEGTSASTRWPEDKQFLSLWSSNPIYVSMKRERLLLILRAIEEEIWRNDILALPVANFDWSKVQVEHILPQKWQSNWALLEGEDENLRDAAVHRIGNLTLVSSPLNAAMSNGPWPIKREALELHSHLRLNNTVLCSETWDESMICKRGKILFDYAIKTWPGPHKF